MHLSNIMIMMIQFEMIKTLIQLLCWELDSKNNHEVEYDSRVLVSSVNLICQDFQCVFCYEHLVLESMQGMLFVRVYCVLLMQACHQ